MVIMKNTILLQYLCRNLEVIYEKYNSWVFLTVKQNTQLDRVKLISDVEINIKFYLLKSVNVNFGKQKSLYQLILSFIL